MKEADDAQRLLDKKILSLTYEKIKSEDLFQSEVQNFKFLTSSLIELIKDQVEE